MRKVHLLVFGLVLIFILGFVPVVFASDDSIMTVEEVESLIESSPNKEVKAYFKTVDRGNKLSTHQVVLRGVFKEPGLKVIMFITRDKIVAGMSGSPVFIGDKKIGALAYSFSKLTFSNYSWGGISPISLMMEEAKSGNDSSLTSRKFSYGDMNFEPIAFGNRLVPGLELISNGKFIVTNRSAEPKVPGVKIIRTSLKDGMPIVVDLIEWTDEKGETTTISAMGTITHVSDDGRVFAFGHPFLNTKNVAYSFRTAEVMGTVLSEDYSYKLTGKTSEVLGAITFDGAYGIYGSTSRNALERVRHFNLEFRKEGRFFHRFNIKIADSILTPQLAQAAFSMIGEANRAPLPQEMSVTQIDTRVGIEGHKSIAWKELFASSATRFGPATLYTSSYKVAYETFFSGIYSTLLNNNYGLKISDVSVSVNFISAGNRTLKLGAYKFPNKVIWGSEPDLEILFVSKENLMAIAKKIKVQIDWSKVEKPVYKKDTLETDKSSEKVVRGVLTIDSSSGFFNDPNNDERQNFIPDYFLGVEDFIESFSRRLEATNQSIFIRAYLRARSGLFDETMAKSEDIMPKDISDDTGTGWYVIEGGLTKRKEIIKNNNMVLFPVNIPPIPSGYVVDQGIDENMYFEVVLEN